jgi:hypothetical protein
MFPPRASTQSVTDPAPYGAKRYPAYRISSSCQGCPRTSAVVHPELTGSPIDALPSTAIRPRPAP